MCSLKRTIVKIVTINKHNRHSFIILAGSAI